uniref:Uncharacterized protein n=1 Tax=Sphaerodactylus townsendi TaxID=933632 RepID=A0ACB8FYD2_9SAUR
MASSCRSIRGGSRALHATSTLLIRRCPRSTTAAPVLGAASAETGPSSSRSAAPALAASRDAHRPKQLPPPPAVDFADTRVAFRSKTSGELARGLLVLGLCSVDLLVERAQQLMTLSQKVLGQRLFENLMKMTFYGQFVAGEDQETIKALIQHNHSYGVGTVLDYSVEEDLTTEEAKKKEPSSCTSSFEKETSKQRETQYSSDHRFDSRRAGVSSNHTYFYADEAKCDQHMDTFLQCIETSAGSSEDDFSAIKLTALGRPQFLLQFSDMLVKWQRFFYQMAAEQGMGGLTALETKLEVKKLQEALAKLGVATKTESQHWFTDEKLRESGTVDLLDWNNLIDAQANLSKQLLVPNMKTGQLEPLRSSFTEEEEMQMKRLLQRIDVLAKKATEMGVRLMVDAEQSYFQPAIRRLALEVQRKFNQQRVAIFNTYQCYLKEAYDNVTVDVELSRREGWHLGAKLVRGAYMDQERSRAAEMGYEDPINPTYQKTSEMYHRCLDYILEEIKHHKKASVMVASHNEDTVKFAIRRMAEVGIHPSENKICFGQLLGMCDQITFPLGQAGFPVYKYVPYGAVSEVLPYLSRRAQENRGFMKPAKQEQHLLWAELKRLAVLRQPFL